MSYLCYLILFAYSGAQHILCFLCLVASFSGLSFLIALSIFSNVYLTENTHLELLSITFLQFYYTYGNDA